MLSHDYIVRRRVERAQEMMLTTDEALSHIALAGASATKPISPNPSAASPAPARMSGGVNGAANREVRHPDRAARAPLWRRGNAAQIQRRCSEEPPGRASD